MDKTNETFDATYGKLSLLEEIETIKVNETTKEAMRQAVLNEGLSKKFSSVKEFLASIGDDED